MREDAAIESDLVVGGYRDRVLTELAQNASDAATRAGRRGAMAVWLDGNDLHVANVGAPLDRSGVASLSALRASDKGAGGSVSVGRFGVGFTAVRSIGDEIEFRSTTGSIMFGAAATRGELAAIGAPEPVEGVPVLRLPWPSGKSPENGWDSEIVVTLRDGVSATALLDAFASEITDLLLELPTLESITLQGNETHRDVIPGSPDIMTIGNRSWWQCVTESSRWLMPMSSGSPVPRGRDVLRAPTRSDEALSLPAMVVTSVDMAPDRRRILPGASLVHVTTGYADMVRSLPITWRSMMIPTPSLPLGDVDAVLRQQILADLTAGAWVPTIGGRDRVPGEVSVLPGASASLCDIVVEVCLGLAPAEFTDAATISALTSVGVRVLGLAQVVELLSGLDREPSWWRALYAELDILVRDSVDLEEIAALPVPLTDGRTVTGPRTVVAMVPDSVTAAVGSISVGSISWARVVHPDAMHPLLTRGGTQQARAADLLTDPVLTELLSDDDTVTDALVDDVLTLTAAVGDSRSIPGLGSLPLRDEDGDYRPADELLLADSPLQSVLAADSPFSLVAADVVERWGTATLGSVGVGWTFGVVRAELPTGPDHDLDDEDAWWDSLAEDPESFVAVRDLDLVDENRWPEALSILLDDPDTAAALVDRGGYTAWWLRRNASVSGQPLGTLRAPDDEEWSGVLDPLEHEHISRLAPVLVGPVVDDSSLARLLLERLADDERVVPPGASILVHGRLADAVDSETIDITEIDPPSGVRCVDGTVCAPGDALVVDQPWLAAVVAPNRLVLADSGTADALADLLDVGLASAAVSGDVVSSGITTTVWADPMLAVVAALSGHPALAGDVTMHDELRVQLSGAVTGERVVPFWVDRSGALHVGRQWAGGR